jgi:tetratricopeptide (TPR) repeat protein
MLSARTTDQDQADALFDQGLALHRAGRLDEAARCYVAALGVDPLHFDTLHRLGVLCVQAGQLDQGAQILGQATAVRPDAADAHGARGLALHRLGRAAEAIEAYRRVAALRPADPQPLFNQAVLLRGLGDSSGALDALDRAMALAPAPAEAHVDRGTLLLALARPAEALAAFECATAIRPDYVEAHNNRGVALDSLGLGEAALAAYDQALALKPGYAEAHANRAVALQRLRRPEDALASGQAAIALDPGCAEAHNTLAALLYDLRRLEAAVAACDRAIALQPARAEFHDSRGVALMDLRRPGEARAGFERAVALQPDFAQAHYNLAMCQLMQGDWASGWAEYEWRWRTREFAGARRALAAPLWLGREDLGGRTILLSAEQGLGDALQFCRYVPEVAARGARVILEVFPGLERLMARLEGAAEIVTHGQAAPATDYQTPLMSLPLALGARIDAPSGPYLSAGPAEAAAWAARLAADAKTRVGLCWAGGLRPTQAVADAIDRRRSLDLAAFEPLARLPGVTLYSLQKGPPAAQLAGPDAPGWAGAVVDHTPELRDFADTAALVQNLDLVVTCDTAVAHLAGAMGKPVWILSRFDACWRWLDGRDDSPWYPSARLFRQTAPGDWDSVVGRVAGELAALRERR